MLNLDRGCLHREPELVIFCHNVHNLVSHLTVCLGHLPSHCLFLVSIQVGQDFLLFVVVPALTICLFVMLVLILIVCLNAFQTKVFLLDFGHELVVVTAQQD